MDVRSNQGIVADLDEIVVPKSTVYVYFAIIAEVNIISVVYIERSGNPEIFSLSA